MIVARWHQSLLTHSCAMQTSWRKKIVWKLSFDKNYSTSFQELLSRIRGAVANWKTDPRSPHLRSIISELINKSSLLGKPSNLCRRGHSRSSDTSAVRHATVAGGKHNHLAGITRIRTADGYDERSRCRWNDAKSMVVKMTTIPGGRELKIRHWRVGVAWTAKQSWDRGVMVTVDIFISYVVGVNWQCSSIQTAHDELLWFFVKLRFTWGVSQNLIASIKTPLYKHLVPKMLSLFGAN